MVEHTKEYIEAEGFTQIVTGTTRAWHDQVDSLLDQIWVNCPQIVEKS